jgi:hypothetical protein
MIDDIFYPEPEDRAPPLEDEAVEIGCVRYKAAYDALDDIKEPYALLILADGGLHCVENSEDVGVGKLARIFVNFASVVAGIVAEEQGEAALDTLLIDTILIAKGD